MGKNRTAAQSWVVNTVSHIQILGLGTDIGDGVPSVLLFFDKRRYLFNVGEGFQRFAMQHQIKLNRVTDILLTRNGSEAAGGLPGLCLTLSDALGGGKGSPMHHLSFHGPTGADDLQHAVRQYVNNSAIHVEGHAVKDVSQAMHQDGTSKDGMPEDGGHGQASLVLERDEVIISAVELLPDGFQGMQHDSGAAAISADAAPPTSSVAASESHERPSKKQKTLSAPFLRDGEAPPLVGEGAACCYMCDLTDTPGRFLPEKATALGVPMGPMFGQLKGGKAVQLPSCKTVQPADVMEASVPGARVVIVDCPSRAYLPALLRAKALHRSSSAQHSEQEPADPNEDSPAAGTSSRPLYVIHLTPIRVASLPEYLDWMEDFPEDAVHILAAINRGCPSLESSATLQAQLNALAEDYFPLHKHCYLSAPYTAGPRPVAGRNLLKIHLRPKKDDPFDDRETRPIFSSTNIQNSLTQAHPEVLEAVDLSVEARAALRKSIYIPPCITEANRETLEVLFLGTGAALPSKYRNVTATYLNLFDKGGMLLDCGEGTYGQLRRRYGAATGPIIAGLKCIWISHIHADHHAGLGRVLAVRTQLLGAGAAPLLVIGPQPLRRVLAAVHRLEPMAFRYVDCAHTLAPCPEDAEAGSPRAAVLAARESLGLSQLESFHVQHCAHAYGVVLESRRGWKLALSGDTRPCPAVAAAAHEATVLIHEATFESSRKPDTGEYEFEQEALAKRHSMTHEAVQTGKQAGAFRTILTHFSQRYPKIPVVDHSFLDSTCIAFDLMSVNLKDLPELPTIIPGLQRLFNNAVVDEEA